MTVDTLEDRIEWLAEEVLIIKEDLGGLIRRVESIEKGRVSGSVMTAPPNLSHEKSKSSARLKEIETDPEDTWAQVGQEVLLPRIAAVCFMLVVALILRTVTDNGMLDLKVGSILGMGYAACLIGTGYYLYTKKSRLSPVFPTCGALLFFSIIFESHVNFSYLSAVNVNCILLIAQIIILAIGLRCQATVLLLLAILGSTAVGFAIGFPAPIFGFLGTLVLCNCIGAYLASIFKISTKLRWYTLFIAIIFWMLWSYKLNFLLNNEPENLAGFGLPLFLPMLFVFWAFYMYASIRKTLLSGLHLDIFYNVLPAVAAGGTFFAANAVLKPWFGQQKLIGLATVLISACYIALVGWLAKRSDEDVPGGKEFVTAATILLVQGMAITLPPMLALPVWAIAAGVLTLKSNQWHSGGIRVISYIFQLFILIFAVKTKSLIPTPSTWAVGLPVAAILSFVSLWLYKWCRSNPPRYDSVFFTLFDKKDRSALVLLLIGIFQSFCMLRFGIFGLLHGTMPDISNAFRCSQSVIVNLLIIVLLIVGLKSRSKEVLMVAGLMIIIAAVKVFLLDLFKANGVPLVLSVFSYGIVAAVSSIVIRKWQQAKKNISSKVVKSPDLSEAEEASFEGKAV